jgi:DNA modification methylase
MAKAKSISSVPWRNRIVGYGEEEASQLLANPKNWRIHPKNQQAALEGSLDKIGWIQNCVVNRSTGFVIDGHARVALAISRGEKVPCLYVELTPQEEALAIATLDSITALARTDQDILDSLVLDLRGFELDLGDGLAPVSGEDDAPPVPEAPVARLGDLWSMGEHRVLCGDSTSTEAVSRLMDGKKARLMATDPPYGVALRLEDNHEASNCAKGINKKYRHFETIMGDDVDGAHLQGFLESVFALAIAVLKDNAAWYLWHAQLTQGFFAAAAAAAQLLVHRQIIWVKPHFVFGRGDYHWQHELCFYGWRKGHRPPFYGQHNQTTIWALGEGGGSIRKEQYHPTQKPVELFAIPIRNHLQAREICYEPFAGSGSQIIAAEKAQVRCFAMELSPAYVDVIVQRWQTFTGKQATLDGHGATFEHVKVGRRLEAQDAIKEEVLTSPTGAQGAPAPEDRADTPITSAPRQPAARKRGKVAK